MLFTGAKRTFGIRSDANNVSRMPFTVKKSHSLASPCHERDRRAVARNAAHHADAIPLYEIARVYDPSDRGDLPEESLALAGAFAGARRSRSWHGEAKEWNFFTAKGILETLFASLRIPNVRFAPVKGMPFHPTRVALLSMGRNVFGMLGEVHPTVCERYGAPERTVAFEIMLAPVLAALPGRPEVEELPRFPSVYLDLAIVVDEMVTAERVGELIEKSGAPEVVSVTLFDVYRGDQVEAGKKSLAYGLELRVGDRTLTDQDAQRVRDRILVVLRERTGAELRA
jgi:phenylalanyl-tRNA synthetase beta chain